MTHVVQVAVQSGAKQRESNLELLRIILMLFIIAHHYVVNSKVGIMMRNDDVNLYSTFYYILGAWGKTGINCFVLITGYFMCKSNISLYKFLKLYLEIKFYQYAIWAIFYFCGLSSFGIRTIVGLLPFTSIGTSFTNAYMAFFLFIPFLNICVKNLSRRHHFLLICLLLWIYTVLCMGGMVTYNYLSWFITLYFIASFIRFYGVPYYNSVKVWGWTTIVLFFVSIGSIFAPLLIGKRPIYFFESDSNHLLALLLSVSCFLFFKNLKIRYNRFINAIAATTFGIFLIHTRGSEMRQWLWSEVIDCGGHYSVDYFWAYAIASVLAIFCVCSIIDLIRIHFLEKNLFVLLGKWLPKYF